MDDLLCVLAIVLMITLVDRLGFLMRLADFDLLLMLFDLWISVCVWAKLLINGCCSFMLVLRMVIDHYLGRFTGLCDACATTSDFDRLLIRFLFLYSKTS